jgi:hypothetical protein
VLKNFEGMVASIVLLTCDTVSRSQSIPAERPRKGVAEIFSGDPFSRCLVWPKKNLWTMRSARSWSCKCEGTIDPPRDLRPSQGPSTFPGIRISFFFGLSRSSAEEVQNPLARQLAWLTNGRHYSVGLEQPPDKLYQTI